MNKCVILLSRYNIKYNLLRLFTTNILLIQNGRIVRPFRVSTSITPPDFMNFGLTIDCTNRAIQLAGISLPLHPVSRKLKIPCLIALRPSMLRLIKSRLDEIVNSFSVLVSVSQFNVQ